MRLISFPLFFMKKFLASLATAAVALSLAVPAFAEGATESRKMMKKDIIMKREATITVNVACMQSAVEKRDTAISDGIDAYAAAVKTALSTRKDALKAAWALTDKTQRNAALKVAWSAFNGTWKKASMAMKGAKNTAWKTFNADAKDCKQPGAESSGMSMDAQL